MKKKNIVYYLTIKDIQTVAEEEIERTLTSEEIEKIIDEIASRMNWYDAIADSISEIITI